MMAAIGTEFLLIVVLILLNGVFAMSEIAVVSARRVRLQQRAEQGDAGARAALALANQPTRFLSTVQVGITLIGTLVGAFGGATLAAELAHRLDRVPFLAPYSATLSLALVVLLITYLSLVLGELVPKRVGMANPERIAALIARPMQGLSKLTAPAVSLLEVSTQLVARLLGIRASEEPPVTEEELRFMMSQGTEAGVFEEAERELVNRVLALGDRWISSMMTPRTEMTWLDIDAPPEANWSKMAASGHTQFPVCRGKVDNVLGMVSTDDLWSQMANSESPSLQAALQEPLFMPETLPILRAVEIFKQTGMETALVLDEYGGIDGLVTLFDILEAVIGEIPYEGDRYETEITRREDGSWLLDGLLPADEFQALFGIKEMPGEDKDYQTLGGLIMALMNAIPAAGDHFDWQGLRIEVVDMDGLRVDKVLVTPAGRDAAAAQAGGDRNPG